MLRSYVTGFLFAVFLTAIPFALVSTHSLSPSAAFFVIGALALIQVLIHLRFFLHLDISTSPRENLLAIAFAAILIFIMIGGSLWIMLDLHQRMMPV